jgi:hypothetical protein
LIIERLCSFQFPALIRSLVVEIADRPWQGAFRPYIGR